MDTEKMDKLLKRKGELITNMEIMQNQLKSVNQQIQNILQQQSIDEKQKEADND